MIRVLQVAAADPPPPDDLLRAIGERPGVRQELLTIEPWKGPRAALRIARLAPGQDVVHAHGRGALRWCRVGMALSGSSARLESTRVPAAVGNVAAAATATVTRYRAAVRSRRLRTEYRSRLERRGRVRRALPIRSA